MRNTAVVAAAVLIAATATVSAQQKADTTKVDADIVAAFPTAPADWKPRLDQDETMKECSLNENSPPKPVADAIQQREKARIEYPAEAVCHVELCPESNYGNQQTRRRYRF